MTKTKKPGRYALAELGIKLAESNETIAKLHATIAAQQDAHAETMRQRDVFARELNDATRKIEQLTIDRDNLLGTIRVMADPNREIRIRMSTVKPADYGTALPSHNVNGYAYPNPG